ncbi:hypothetical protein BD626DRAFT_630627 [Schizophyllum amplum]|uniref:Uncharacterized protein n=1 Tax=Schizophyllum amplum TaxID=97359 RepID=A0A550CDZ5_9AGAR|nr:hypothetical protein BD626DRAFT_630627 [Auriculariopsis ampla]
MSTSSTEPTAFEGDGRSQVILRNRKILVVCHKDELEDLSAKDFIELFTREVVEDAPGTAFTASALVDKFIKQGMWVGGVCITVLRYAFMLILSAVLFQGLRALIRAELEESYGMNTGQAAYQQAAPRSFRNGYSHYGFPY